MISYVELAASSPLPKVEGGLSSQDSVEGVSKDLDRLHRMRKKSRQLFRLWLVSSLVGV